MPLSKIQTAILRIIAQHRDAESYVAGATHHPIGEWNRLASAEPIDPDRILACLRTALDEAQAFVARMPTKKLGALFLKDGQVVQPDADRLDDYHEHHGHRGGQWPSDLEIMRAMLERYSGIAE